jgi:hypothetical protein
MEQSMIAYEILKALTESSWAEDMEYYRDVVQEDLKFTDEQMKMFDLSKICEALKPVEHPVKKYKGRSLKKLEKPVETLDSVFSKLEKIWVVDSAFSPPPTMPCETHNTEERVMDAKVEDSSQPFIGCFETKENDKPFQLPNTAVCVGGVCYLSDQRKEPSDQRKEPSDQRKEPSDQRKELVENQVVEQNPSKEDENKEAVQEEKPKEQVTILEHMRSSSSESDDMKNKHPAAKALRKLCRKNNIPMFHMDTEMYEKALILTGDHVEDYKEQLTEIGGKWNMRLGGFVFSKGKLVGDL